MALTQVEAAEEMLQAQAHVMNNLYAFARSMCLKCALELNIPDTIYKHGAPMTLTDLVAALGLPTIRKPHLRRLMRLLAHSGLFIRQINGGDLGEEAFLLTPSSKLLIKENKISLATFVLVQLHEGSMLPWYKLSAWFKNEGGTPFELAHGAKPWDFISQNLEMNDFFNSALASDSRLTMSAFVAKCGGVLKGIGKMVDVGGGNGAVAKSIVEAFPHIKCTVMDLPHVVDGLAELPGVDFVGGDMFASVPPADAVFLKNILHDWSDEQCVKILQNCRKAIPSRNEGGKVILVEIVVGAKSSDSNLLETMLFMDLSMMAHVEGKEREEEEWKKIFATAGFSDYKIHPVLGLRSLIEVYPY